MGKEKKLPDWTIFIVLSTLTGRKNLCNTEIHREKYTELLGDKTP